MQVLPRRARTARAVKEAKEAAPAAGRAAGSVARPLRPAARPLYTRFANIFVTSISKATMRLNPRRAAAKHVDPRALGAVLRSGRLWGLFFCCVIYIQRGRDAKLRRELI